MRPLPRLDYMRSEPSLQACSSHPLGQGALYGLHSYTTNLPVPPTKTSPDIANIDDTALLTNLQDSYLRNGTKTQAQARPTYCGDLQLHAASSTLEAALPLRRDTKRTAMEV